MKKKTKIIISAVSGAVILSIIAFIAGVKLFYIFYGIQNNEYNSAAMTYIWNSDEIAQQIGEIKHVGINVKYKKTVSDEMMILPYGAETDRGHAVIMITLIKEDGVWIVESYEIVENKNTN